MNKTLKLSEAEIELKKGKYVVLYDDKDPRNNPKKDDKSIICIIGPADKLDDIDLQNAAILKESRNILATLLQVRDKLSKPKRSGFSGILAKDTINLINGALGKIYSK